MYTFAKKWTLLLRSGGLRYVDGEYVIIAMFSLFSAKMKDEKITYVVLTFVCSKIA